MCEKCSKPLEVGDMRATGPSSYQCVSCYGGAKKTVASTAPIEEFFEAKKYQCDNCQYEFSRKASAEVKSCPYCGRTKLSLL